MERWSHDKRIAKSLSLLLGDQPASGFLVVHERPRWAAPVSALGVVAVAAVSFLVEPIRPLTSALIMLAILGPLNWTGRRWILARSGPSVVLAESPTWFPKATRVIAIDEAPLPRTASGGLLTKWVMLFDRRCVLPWIHRDRLLRIIG